MKVGTDSVLLGAWAFHNNPRYILDVGTGTGLLALMMAQRFPSARIYGVEINPEAARLARENVAESKWKDRIEIIYMDYLSYTPPKDILFDLIVSNPPFFSNSLNSPDPDRTLARHQLGLNQNALIGKAAAHINQDGYFSVVLPFQGSRSFIDECYEMGLYLNRMTRIFPVPGKECKRVLMSFSALNTEVRDDELVLEKFGRHGYSDEYLFLVKEFYPWA